MNSSEICTLAINIVIGTYGPTTYRLGNTDPVSTPLNNMTWYQDAWRSDCLGFVRACLCGWNGDKTVYYGGSDASLPCYNFNELDFVASCSSSSYDFTDISLHPCSLLEKNYPYRHVGLYVGEFQFDGKVYNVCECTSSLNGKNGCLPTWVDNDGTRRLYKDGAVAGSAWLQWGIFNTNGTDYLITNYDGGASGATGFGSALTQSEAIRYFQLNDGADWLSYEYLEALADTLYGMDSSYFRCYAGYVYGENPWWYDDYMLYLDSSICVNRYMGYNITTLQGLSDVLAGGDHSGYYDVSQLQARGTEMQQQPNTLAARRTRTGIYLALLNPMQECIGCHGVEPKPSSDLIIYTQYDVQTWGAPEPEVWAIRDSTLHDYDITGSGIRGGTPSPGPKGRTNRVPLWLQLKPWWSYYYNHRRRF